MMVTKMRVRFLVVSPPVGTAAGIVCGRVVSTIVAASRVAVAITI